MKTKKILICTILVIWGVLSYGGIALGTTTTLPSTIAGGGHHTIILKSDGTVWTCGDNTYGQLGDGTFTNKTNPVQASGLTSIIKVSAGENHSLALKSDGTVWAWGYNLDGELGIGTMNHQNTPSQVQELSGVISIAAGAGHSLALKSDGTVWAWGRNWDGQLGNGTSVNYETTPVPVQGLSGVIFIACGQNHSLALKSDGSIWTWGKNNYGQLGEGSTNNRNIPIQVAGLSGIIAVSGGAGHSLALKSDGSVWAWGDNYYGQLGDGTTNSQSSPIQVPGLNGAISVFCSAENSLVLKSDGTVWAWGRNQVGQLGDGTYLNRYHPIQINSLNHVKEIAGGSSHTIIRKSDGTIWSWGSNDQEQLGDGTSINKNNPMQINGLSDHESHIISVFCGGRHSIILKSDGTVWTWGRNDYGQLGDGTTATRTLPIQIKELTNIREIIASSYHTIALRNDGTVWAWGRNDFGQLGDGTTLNRSLPVQVLGVTNVKEIAVGSLYTVVLKNDGTVWAWGRNDFGQLGDGTTIDRNIPVQVAGLTNIKTIAAGEFHTGALRDDGTVWTWGKNNYGQLGDGTNTNKNNPVCLLGVTNVKTIETGSSYTAILKSDGTEWAWGRNDCGQLGDGSWVSKNFPVQTQTTNVRDIGTGLEHSIAVKADGTVWTWGWNYFGQLGDGTKVNKNIPTQVPNLIDIKMADGGVVHSLALGGDGTIWSWGDNYDGQLGDGTATFKLSPVNITPVPLLLKVVDQYGQEIVGSKVGVGLNTFNTGVMVSIPLCANNFTIMPGLNKSVGSGTYLKRIDQITINENHNTISFEWKTSPITINIVDQYGIPIPKSSVSMGNNYSWSIFDRISAPATVSLPVTDESIYPTIGGTYINGYPVYLAPGCYNATGDRTVLNRVEYLEVTDIPVVKNFEWKTSQITINIVDQNGIPIPKSVVSMGNNYTWYIFDRMSAPATVRLPVTDEGIYPTIGGTYINGYPVYLAPGCYNATGDRTVLNRVEYLEVTDIPVVKNFEWKTSPVTINMVDQNGISIPKSIISMGYNYNILYNAEAPVTVNLPITDEAVYPTMTGWSLDGYPINIAPGWNNLKGSMTFLQRTEKLEVTVTPMIRNFEWIIAPVTVCLVDQNRNLINNSYVKIDNYLDWTKAPVSIKFPVTDKNKYPTISGTFSNGYSFQIAPGANGQLCAPSCLSRAETATITSSMSSLNFEWKTALVSLNLVDQNNQNIPNSQLKIENILDWTKTPFSLSLPVTDAAIYPTISGIYRNGFSFQLAPGRNGQLGNYDRLGRNEIRKINLADNILNFDWFITPVTIQVMDSNNNQIPQSPISIDGAVNGTILTPTNLQLPITDETVYPSMSGADIGGYTIRNAIETAKIMKVEITKSTGAINVHWDSVSGNITCGRFAKWIYGQDIDMMLVKPNGTMIQPDEVPQLYGKTEGFTLYENGVDICSQQYADVRGWASPLRPVYQDLAQNWPFPMVQSGTVAIDPLLGRFAFFTGNISEGSQLTLTGFAYTGFAVPGIGAVKVQGNYAYIAAGEGNFQIIDISDKSSPLVIGHFGIPGINYSLEVSGNIAYFPTWQGGIYTVDITNAAEPRWPNNQTQNMGAWVPPAGSTKEIKVYKGYAFVTVSSATTAFYVLDISDPCCLKTLATVDIGDPHGAIDLFIDGDRAYIGIYGRGNGTEIPTGGGAVVIDIHDPLHPTLLGSYKGEPGDEVYDTPYLIGCQGNTMIMATQWLPAYSRPAKLILVDATDPGHPIRKGAYAFIDESGQIKANVYLKRCVAEGNYLYVTDSNYDYTQIGLGRNNPPSNLYTLDIRDLTRPLLINTYPQTPAKYRYISKYDHYLYINDYNYGIRIFDIANPKQPVNIGGTVIAGEGHWLWVNEDATRAYLSQTFGGAIYAIDITTPQNPKIIGKPYWDGEWQSDKCPIFGKNNIIFDVTDASINLVDFSDPSNPYKIGDCPGFPSDAIGFDVDMNQNLLFTVYTQKTTEHYFTKHLAVHDISQPNNPRLISELALPLQSGYYNMLHIKAAGNYVYLTSTLDKKFLIIDVSNPNAPLIKSIFDGSAYFNDFEFRYGGNIAVSKGIAYINSGEISTNRGIHIIDISNPSQPTYLRLLSCGDMPQDFQIYKNYLILGRYYKTTLYDISIPRNPVWLESDYFGGYGSWSSGCVRGDKLYYPSLNGLKIVQLPIPSEGLSGIITVRANLSTNRPPVFDSVDNQTVNEGQLLQFTVHGADPDGDTLSYTATNLPSGASFNPVSSQFNWTPDYTQAGSYNVHFEVSDGKLIDSKDITITVNNVNRAPVANAGPDQTLTATSGSGDLVTLNGAGSSDPDNDSLTYTWTGPFGTVIGINPVITLPPGTWVYTLLVNDGLSSSSDSVTIKVITNVSTQFPITLEPNGYLGYLSIDNVGTLNNGQVKTFNLIPGQYKLSDPYSYDLNGQNTSFGSFSVNIDGSIVADITLRQFFIVSGTTLAGKVAPVTIDFNEYNGYLGFYNIKAYKGPGAFTTKLIVGRRYSIYDDYSYDLTQNSVYFGGAGYQVSLSLDGMEVTLNSTASNYFRVSGTTLTANTGPVTIDFNEYQGYLGFNNIITFKGSGVYTTKLIIGRRYTICGEYSYDLNQNSIYFGGVGYQVGLNLDGAAITLNSAASNYFHVSGTTLTANTAPVTIDFNEYKGYIGFNNIIGFNGPSTYTAKLIIGRRYTICGEYSYDLNQNSIYFGGVSYQVSLSLDGTAITLNSAASDYFRVFGTTLTANTVPVTIDFNEYQGYLGFNNIIGFKGPGAYTAKLIIGRRYTICGEHSYDLHQNNIYFGGVSYQVSLCLDGTAITLNSAASDYFRVSGTTLTANTAPVTIDFNEYQGYLGFNNVIGFKGPGTYTTKLIIGRRYTICGEYSSDLIQSNIYFGGIRYQVGLNLDGTAVNLDPVIAQYFRVSGTTLTANTIPVLISPNGFLGYLGIYGVIDGPGNGQQFTRSLILGRRYTLQPGGQFAVNFDFTCSPMNFSYYGYTFTLTCITNQAPIANAGPDQLNIEANSANGVQVHFDGSTSSDPDGDILTYTWSGPFGTITGVSPTVQIPLGAYTITLKVNDGSLEATDTLQISVVDTTPPAITIPTDITVAATGETTSVTLPTTTAIDLVDGMVSVVNNAPAVYPLGVTEITFTASDNHGNTAIKTMTVTIIDSNPPLISISGITDGAIYTETATPVINLSDCESGVKTRYVTLDGISYTTGTEITALGNHTLVVSAMDYANNTATQTIHFNIYANTNLSITATPCEYSDSTQLIATLTARGTPVSGELLSFKVNGVWVGSTTTNADGKAVLNPVINLPTGTYPITVSYTENPARFLNAAEGSGNLTISAEKATLTYTGQLLVQYPGSLTLAAVVNQENDNSLGALNLAKVKFEVVQVNSDGTTTPIGIYIADCTNSGTASTTQNFGVGVYSITASIMDEGYYQGPVDTAITPVYDPNGGQASGGGWINITDSTNGNLGRANLGFIAKYKDNSSTGNLEFQYKDGNINLKSIQIDWLVISSVSAQFQGIGTIKGWAGTYTFRVTCTDNEQNGHPDKFTIKIWAGTDTDTDQNLVYKALNVDLGGGNIVVKTH
ncbi:MAG: putative Ig domain-containing protein [Firmicutes bacterium]|nr:putative Ig domain-containing protein [Bacillota bacterium]